MDPSRVLISDAFPGLSIQPCVLWAPSAWSDVFLPKKRLEEVLEGGCFFFGGGNDD